jgi:hypothetical protein
MLAAQSLLLLLPLPSQMKPPEKYCNKDSKEGEEEEVVIEDIGIMDWLLR